jgi:hypothetical protein
MRDPSAQQLPRRRLTQLTGRPAIIAFLAHTLLVTVFLACSAMAQQVWTGPTIGFTNFSVSDVDHITASVAITRGDSRGLFNPIVESSYTHSLSPIGTEWAFGELTTYASLVYNNWEDWFGGAGGGGPPSTLGRDAVLHIIPEDVYIGIEFTSWGVRSGGFSYTRTTAATVPEPSCAVIGALGLAIAASRKFLPTGRL